MKIVLERYIERFPAKIMFVLCVFFIRDLCLKSILYQKDSISAHLTAQWYLGAQLSVGVIMQCHAVPDTMLQNDGNEPVAGIGVVCSKRSGLTCLPWRDIYLDRPCAQRCISSLGYMLIALDVTANCLDIDHVSYSAHGALCAIAIHPAMALAGLLAEFP